LKKLLFKIFALAFFLSCTNNEYKQPEAMELEEIAKFALSKQVKLVVDSLHLDSDKLIFIDEPPRILRSVRIDYANKGTIEFFFGRTSIISDIITTKEQYLSKVGKKVIDVVEWRSYDGKKGSIRNIKVY